MTDSQKQEFTRRITNANKSELVVILYDMLDVYLMDAITAYDEEKSDNMISEIQKARNIISELIATLDRQYEISSRLYSIYRYVERLLITAEIRRNSATLNEAARYMRSLGSSFREIAKNDNDLPIMQNTETVYAGMTYGRNSVNENSAGGNRGFFA